MKIWFWHKKTDTEPRGPVSENELKELAKTGDLDRDDKIWKEGFDDWVIASSLKGIFTIPPPIKEKLTTPPEISYKDKSVSVLTYPLKKGVNEKDLMRNSPEKRSDNSNTLKGYGGWLAFFCISITVLRPLIAAGQLYTSWEELSPLFDLIPVLESALLLETFTIIGISIYSLFIGLTIWGGIENGNLIAQKYLKIRLIVFIILNLTIFLMLSGDSFIRSILMEDALIVIFAEIVFFGIWFSYFKKSKRVANTYPTLQNT